MVPRAELCKDKQIDKYLAKLCRERENTVNDMIHGKGEMTRETTGVKTTIREHGESLDSGQLENLEEMDVLRHTGKDLPK
jgi:hypothetical protein